MIKPTNISPIETTKSFYYECDNCGNRGKVNFTNRVINTDNEYDLKELGNEPCPHCSLPLGVEKKMKKFQIRFKTGEVLNKGAESREELDKTLKKWFATGVAGVVTMKSDRRVAPEDIEEIVEIPTCPKCGSENIRKTGLSSGVGSGPGFPPTTSHQYKCGSCGYLFSR